VFLPPSTLPPPPLAWAPFLTPWISLFGHLQPPWGLVLCLVCALPSLPLLSIRRLLTSLHIWQLRTDQRPTVPSCCCQSACVGHSELLSVVPAHSMLLLIHLAPCGHVDTWHLTLCGHH
jgi:hypothetical protein